MRKRLFLFILLSMIIFSKNEDTQLNIFDMRECRMSGIQTFNMNNKENSKIKEIRPINCLEKQQLGGNYYRDNEAVYLNATNSSLYGGWVWLDMLNPDTTVYLGRDYIKDDKYVYNYAGIIDGADVKTFEILEKSFYYSKDKAHVFYRGMEIEGSEPSSFEILDGGYAKDRHNVYYQKKKLEKADVKTFKMLKEGDYIYSKDRKYIYYRENIIKEADRKTFKALNFKYAKDKNYVYIHGIKIDEADTNTFKLYSGSDPEFKNIGKYYDSMDKNNYYSNGEVVNKK